MSKSMRSKTQQFFTQLLFLFKTPLFWGVTLLGNSIVLIAAAIFYLLEKPHNSQIHHAFDPIWWAFTTVTTVGYGDITPITFQGKILGIGLMLVGTALFATYTALLSNVLLGNQFMSLKRKVSSLEKDLSAEQSQNTSHEEHVLESLEAIKAEIIKLEARMRK